jgi:hypothetical protein
MHAAFTRPFLALASIAAGLVLVPAAHAATPAHATNPARTAARTAAAAPTLTAAAANHFLVNLQGSTRPMSLGYNVLDVGSTTQQVNALPDGTVGMVWLGQKCPTKADATFKAVIDRLASNPKVYGYYLSDEPHIADCARGPAALETRATYIRLASGGRQRSFIVLSKAADYKAFRPTQTRVSLFGLDPYPCSTAHPSCDISMIPDKVNKAVAYGIPRGRIVPVYQAFGQSRTAGGGYYRLPSATQLQAILQAWSSAVPDARLDYTYGWGNQSSANPTLADATTLQGVFKNYFAG